MSERDRLETYARRRRLDRSGEPSGGQSPGGPPRFVIQEHHASTLHYDLRLEVEGVLASWAVPKGPSTDPRDKRLALRTEDHPLDYADFEGQIPEGEYGAGTVIVWDRGDFENRTTSKGEPLPLAQAIDRGHVKVDLHGEKIRGGYALQRVDDAEDRWILIKTRDEAADARRDPTSTQPASVLSGRTAEDIAKR